MSDRPTQNDDCWQLLQAQGLLYLLLGLAMLSLFFADCFRTGERVEFERRAAIARSEK